VDQASPLFNARIVAFIHDEFIAEVDDAPSAHDAAHELARLMVEGANVYLPDVPIPLSKMEPLLMRRWSKKAEPRFSTEGGRLVPWE
jgi:DNA polymerase-1